MIILLGQFGGGAFAQSISMQSLSPDEARFGELLNQFRQALNLPTLSLQAQLENVSRMHSNWMVNHNFLSHYESIAPATTNGPFDRMAAQGYSQYFYAGENIACGNSDPLKTFQQWAFSPGHLQNMVNPHYHEMGIAESGPGNGDCPYFWTNDYGSEVNPATDGPGTTDLNLIAQAIVQVSGPIPEGITVSLTEAEATPTPLPAPVIVPAPVIPVTTPPASTPTSAPLPAPTGNDITEVSANARIASATHLLSLKCTIPYSIGTGIVTNFLNTDTELQATRQSDGSYSVTLSYLQNGVTSNIYPVSLDGVTMVRSPDFPVFTMISAPTSRIGGFAVEIDLGANHAQFDSFGATPQVTAALACTIQY
jgi:hypothetical protein